MYPKLSEIKPGDRLIADAGFSCMDEDEVYQVFEDEAGLYVCCNGPSGDCNCAPDRHHYLDGDQDGRVVGMKRYNGKSS